VESDRSSTRTLVSLFVAWALLMAASVLLQRRDPPRPGAGGVHPWLPFLFLQALALLPALACWGVALRRRLDLPPALFLAAHLPLAWALLVACSLAALVYLAS
jgi:hypothetical protein